MALLSPFLWKVEAGQTWNQIANALHIPVADLLRANDIAPTGSVGSNTPRAGRVILLPLGVAG